MKKIIIEKDIPLPRKSVGGKKIQYPWHEMAVGDSFKVDIDGKNPKSIASMLATSARQFSRRHNLKYYFATRVFATEVRIWRIE